MSRLEEIFARCRAERRRALVIYLTAGDPDAETSTRLVLAAARAGADVVELGVPWSDPSADGPVIQAAMLRALAAGGGLGATLALCRAVRRVAPALGLVLFGYANPIVVRGADRFAAEARDAGADGVLCVDWPPDEDRALAEATRAHGLDLVTLVAPTSTPARVAAAVAAAGGFVYYVSMTGITGGHLATVDEARQNVDAIRAAAGGRLPVVVGFGVSTPDDVRRLASFADGVVVGSAAVRAVDEARAAGRDPADALSAFVACLRAALAL